MRRTASIVGLGIGIFQSTAAIVKTDDGAVARTRKNAFGNAAARRASSRSPMTLHITPINPRRSCISRNPNHRTPYGGRMRTGVLDVASAMALCARSEFTHYIRWTPQRKIRVRMRVVADFVRPGTIRPG